MAETPVSGLEMLKAPEPTTAPGQPEPSIGDLASQLVDDAKAYARAEADLAKAIAREKANAAKTPLILLVLALFVAMAALNALAVGIFAALATLMGPLLAGIAAFVLIGAAAGILAWAGYSKLRSAL